MALSFHDRRFEEPKYSAKGCPQKGLTYSALIRVELFVRRDHTTLVHRRAPTA